MVKCQQIATGNSPKYSKEFPQINIITQFGNCTILQYQGVPVAISARSVKELRSLKNHSPVTLHYSPAISNINENPEYWD